MLKSINKLFALQQFVYLILLVCSAFAAYIFFDHRLSCWLVWTALSLAFLNTDVYLPQKIKSLVEVAVLLELTVWVAGVTASHFFILLIDLVGLTMLAVYWGQKNNRYFYPAMIITLFTMLASLQPITLADNLLRAYYILLGLLLTLLVQVVYWRYDIKKQIIGHCQSVLRSLQALNTTLFACYIQPGYQENIYLFEKRLHDNKWQTMQAMHNLYQLAAQSHVHSATKQQINTLAEHFGNLYTLLLMAAQMRWRISDYSILTACQPEMTAIAEELDSIFTGLMTMLNGKKYHADNSGLAEKIEGLERNYQHVLQVAMREPLVMLLFIANLQAFNTEITHSYHALFVMKNAQAGVQRGGYA